ncbi:hypothetical protein PAXRUDRAFT_617036 [Paxillus rubicundulus Ve08.2h10]|uniref:Uncharacterized protein n=1 Tax=Paxillus rubicundulus Ve08.2h10 TaxID=930991 RepID=A0A0D0E3N1_9AGAM|nr:hypothetical protein PAXRUDRAFT_617036 [Paxillus rubicundulus Ve08.2h10]
MIVPWRHDSEKKMIAHAWLSCPIVSHHLNADELLGTFVVDTFTGESYRYIQFALHGVPGVALGTTINFNVSGDTTFEEAQLVTRSGPTGPER